MFRSVRRHDCVTCSQTGTLHLAPLQPSTHAHTPGGIESIVCDRRVASSVAFVGATKSVHRPCRPHAGHSTDGAGGGGGGDEGGGEGGEGGGGSDPAAAAAAAASAWGLGGRRG